MRKLAVLAVAAATVFLPVAVSAQASAATVVAAPNAVDLAYLQKNAQTDLAEITLGTIAESRAQSDAALELARMTKADHEAALAKVQAIADNLGVALPTAPNPAQQADAAKLKSVSDSEFDLTYAQIQVVGHQLSIADTNTELSAGSDESVQAFASAYLPVAQMHLTMATDLLTSLGGSVPSAVPAGSGGAGATTSAATLAAELILGVLGIALIGVAFTLVSRRRRVS
jgi:putative membrane protein